MPGSHPSIVHSPDVYCTATVNSKFTAGRYIGPFLMHAAGRRNRPFPNILSFVPKASDPGKYWAVHKFSFPHHPQPDTAPINSHIDSDNFPFTSVP
jgi:hypothetical protein